MGRAAEQTPFVRMHANNEQIYEKIFNFTIRKMQLKTTMRYHLTPVRMAIINRTGNNKCWRVYRGKEILLHCCWECKLVSHYGKQGGVPSKN